MKKIYFITIIFALIFAIAAFWASNKSDKNQKSRGQAPQAVAQIPNLEAWTNNEGAVEITVAPKNLSDKEWVFEITLNTHSEELTTDLAKTTVLFDDKGNEYAPIVWEGDPPGGHHRQGILRFAPILSQPKSIALKIFQIGGIGERNFTWQFR